MMLVKLTATNKNLPTVIITCGADWAWQVFQLLADGYNVMIEGVPGATP